MKKKERLFTSDVAEGFISTTDIKHFIYCPRIVYFEKVLHVEPQLGSQQEESKKIHEKLEEEELRRKGAILYSKELENVEKFFKVPLTSKKLNLQGVIDCIIKSDNEYIPVDYKNMESNKGKPWIDHKYQLAAYALLIEENYNTIVKKGYINYTTEKLTTKVDITPTIKTHIKRILTQIEEIIKKEKPPLIRVVKEKCTGGCGYKWICTP
ncbi:MAG: CRISPR-associated protein Cas4 [Candidatus Bathyarchaeota archaeon]|nr:CRISPR-associated protein Cas4 [Candidatus Bathyarchaeota archaeon]